MTHNFFRPGRDRGLPVVLEPRFFVRAIMDDPRPVDDVEALRRLVAGAISNATCTAVTVLPRGDRKAYVKFVAD